ncbi:NAD/FAD-utilizing enzyme [Exilibacterium tricleocarpae]|uniref:NAD/FAD-utilizing enzyme n=1 Tax=Exilibacterium tricleocarpae TaxID=2591008 RepID=A0A545UBD1_9GAMM|nr:NAD/FAD-utilizing enzyme [Exilibacterium tricleocarpae]TQV86776.1 NAD/FAD-utilizing enzyme [Exilibacterium tricleocarpae]
MQRHYFISDNLDDLEAVEQELEAAGVTTPQIHVLSDNDAEVEKHHLHEVESVLKKDVVHSTEIGALIGVVAAAVVLGGAYLFGWTNSPAGWIPFIFLAVVVLGFCTWEGGLFGIQEPHHDFKRFEDVLQAGKHIFFVDVDPEQEAVLEKVAKAHPQLLKAGTGDSAPHWVVTAQQKFRQFVRWAP